MLGNDFEYDSDSLDVDFALPTPQECFDYVGPLWRYATGQNPMVLTSNANACCRGYSQLPSLMFKSVPMSPRYFIFTKVFFLHILTSFADYCVTISVK